MERKKHIKVNSNLKNKFYTKINDKNLKIFFNGGCDKN